MNQTAQRDGYTPLHWAASTEEKDAALVKLLLDRGADPNRDGGENVEAFMGTPQTPLMLARRRGETSILAALSAAGAIDAAPDRVSVNAPVSRVLPATLDPATLRSVEAKGRRTR